MDEMSKDIEDLDNSENSKDTDPDFFGEPDSPFSVRSQPQNTIPYQEFEFNFHSTCEPYDSVRDICEANAKKVIDLRPYMESRPYTCFQKDNLHTA